ncbi:MAG: tripartite tricarboxylate transporter substrate binding protein [Pirellulaceae bacterium]
MSTSKPLSIVRKFWNFVSTLLIVALAFWWIMAAFSGDLTGHYPNQPIQIVVPYGAGGGSDTFVRTLQQGVIEDQLLDQPLVIVNKPGGSGTIGSRSVKDARPDGYKILCQHNAIITAKLAGTVDYGAEAFEPIAMTGELSLVIIVREDAPYQDLPALLDAAKQYPKQVRFGANRGAPAYFTTLQMEDAWPGAQFSIVSADGGADRYSKIIGGHLDAGIFSLSEYLDFRSPAGTPADQNIRAISIMGPQRHPSIPDVATATEQNVPVLLSNAHYWWAPKGTPSEVLDKLADVLQKAMQNETVRSELARLRVDANFMQGEPLAEQLAETITRFEANAEVKASVVPKFTHYVLAIVAGLFVWVMVQSKTPVEEDRSTLFVETERFTKRPGTALTALAILMIYVVVLGQGWLPFALTTAVMVFIVGFLITRQRLENVVTLVQVALLTGLGIQFVFTQVFATVLP